MAKYFLGSVGIADAYKIIEDDYGNLQKILAFECKTLTDSAINISMTEETVLEAQNGAPVCNFYHSPNITVTLTDIRWDEGFIESQTGKFFNLEGTKWYSDGFTATTTEYTLGYPFPEVIGISKEGEHECYSILIKEDGATEWTSCISYSESDKKPQVQGKDYQYYYYTPDKKIQGLKSGTKYCIRYLYASNDIKTLILTSGIIPAELFLEVHTPVFAMDVGCTISDGRSAGEIIYEIPRFEMDGNLSLSNSMSSSSSLSINGNVLMCDDEQNSDEGGTMIRIKEYIKNSEWYEGLVAISYDPSTAWTKTPDTGTVVYCGKVYGIYNDGRMTELTSYRSSTDTNDFENIKLCYTATQEVESTHEEKQWGSNDQHIYTQDTQTYNIDGIFNSNITKGKKADITVTVMYCCKENGNVYLTPIDNLQDSGEYTPPSSNKNYKG